jgi:hypothetical protein
MFFHIWFVGIILGAIVTAVGVGITNENDPLPMPAA